MQNHLYYAILGRVYAFAYHTRWHRFLGYALSSWLKLLVFILFMVAYIRGWGTLALAVTGGLFVLLLFAYWRVQRLGFNRFVPDANVSPPAQSVEAIKAGRRVSLYATGVYSLADRSETVLLRPADYWHSARGEHSVMVNERGRKYLYQFFKESNLSGVAAGWLIFGSEPMHTLAITFFETWGPDQADSIVTYMVSEEKDKKAPGKKRTIYFTFEDTAVQAQVWQTILQHLPD